MRISLKRYINNMNLSSYNFFFYRYLRWRSKCLFNLQLFQVIVKFCLYLSVTKRLAYYMQFQFKSFRKNIWRLRPFTFTANRFQPLWKNQQNTVFECSLYIFLLIYMILYCMTWLHLIYTKIMPRDLFPPGRGYLPLALRRSSLCQLLYNK